MDFAGLREEYFNIPIITRIYTTACILTTLAVQLELVSPYQLYFSSTLIFKNLQVWRCITSFLFFGPIGFGFFFNLGFTFRYCRMLEEVSFHGRTADFVMMMIFGNIMVIFVSLFVNLLFLGQAFTLMLVYIWSRRNPYIRLTFFGILSFQAPYLPWVLLAFSVLLGNPFLVDLIGMGVGHLYYFLEDVFPYQPYGFKILKTPQILKQLFDPIPEDSNYNPIPEDRPGGFQWNQQQQ